MNEILHEVCPYCMGEFIEMIPTSDVFIQKIYGKCGFCGEVSLIMEKEPIPMRYNNEPKPRISPRMTRG